MWYVVEMLYGRDTEYFEITVANRTVPILNEKKYWWIKNGWR